MGVEANKLISKEKDNRYKNELEEIKRKQQFLYEEEIRKNERKRIVDENYQIRENKIKQLHQIEQEIKTKELEFKTLDEKRRLQILENKDKEYKSIRYKKQYEKYY